MQLTEEQHLIQDMAKSFAQEQIKPFASEWDQKGIFPKMPWPKWESWVF